MRGVPHLPQGRIGKAIRYTYNIYNKLTRYHLDGRWKMDNNLAENEIRPIAVGRKNWLFCKNHDAAESVAIIYSLLGCCKSSGVNFREWLVYFIENIHRYDNDYGKDLTELLPHNFATTQKAEKTQKRLLKFSEYFRETLKIIQNYQKSRRGLPNAYILHWILNPGLVVNELILGQTIPKIMLLEREGKKPFYQRSLIPCPHCGKLHSGLKFSAQNKTAVKNWFGFYCDNCKEIIPVQRNLTSIIILIITYPIWGWFRKTLKKNC